MKLGQVGTDGSLIVEAVANAAAAVARCEDLDDVLTAVVEQAMALGATSSMVLLTVSDEEGALRLFDRRNLPPAIVEGMSHVTFDTPCLACRAAKTRDLQIIEDVERIDPALTFAREILRHTGSRSMFSVPLLAFGRLLGVLTWTLPEPYSPTTRERAAIRAIAEVFAIGIAKAEAQLAPAGVEAADAFAHLAHAIAERHQIESALRDRETRLRAIFDHSFEFIGLLSTSGVLLEANRAALEFVGTKRSEVIGRPFWEGPWWSHSVDTQEELKAAIEKAARGEHVQFETRHVSREGKTSIFEFSLSPVRDESGAVVLLVPEGHDITERKEWERQREEWISIIAHDLRQPLNVIAGWSTLIARSPSARDPDVAEAVGHIKTSVTNLARMTADLLDASRLEAGRMTLNRQPADLETVVQAIVARNVLEGHEVRFEVQGEVPPLSLDVPRLEQGIVNLLSNAIKYGHAGKPIEVGIARVERAVMLSVSNWGDGIDAAEMPQLFSRFHRTAKARAGKKTGIGLGLYIARGIVEAHGGRLFAKSTPGAQTTFHVELPI